jgi:NAD(P)-dependent dehydrogenase (short-subunit alcohol dehydrogenase family)
VRDHGNGAKNRETCEINRFLPPEDGATNGMELNGKVILITGASSGIGRAVALALSHGHNDLVITARRTELLNDLAKAVESNGSRCAVLAGDALLEERAEEVVREAVARFGRIDAALLNIGAGPPMNTATVSPEVIKGNMRLNYDSMINYFYPLVRQMKSQGAGGLIAHTNSLAGFFGLPMQGPYSAAKAACRIFLDTARIELKPYNIRILTICPGFVNTERIEDDGIPKPLCISAQEAAGHILKALRREPREFLFPPVMKWITRLGRILPGPVVEKILMKFVPPEY